ncbi:uncharacterized protein LOC134278403 [Saccostrea cucullata]|uniref:uncharacterized protein LOC134278403 n=1 Tax=Saccostrea cuccullata TaxID=36930 RepID=UPI002ED285BA
MWAIEEKENVYYVMKNNTRMRFSRSKHMCPPLERLDLPCTEDLRSKHMNCDPQKAVILTFQGGKKQFASRGNYDWNYNGLCRQFKNFTDPEEFVSAVNAAMGVFDVVYETQMQSDPMDPTPNNDDSGIFDFVCPETCMEANDNLPSSSESNEPPTKKQKVKPLQTSLNKSKPSQREIDEEDKILKRIKEKTLPGIHQILLTRIDGPERAYRDTNTSFVKQIQNGQTLSCTSPQPLALHLIGENVMSQVDIQHLSGYSYTCLGGNHQRLAANENHVLYPNMPQYLSLPSLIFVNLTHEEEIFVAANHNIIGHNISKISHKDMVKMFRSLKPEEIDVELCRCENTKAWRSKCQQHLPPGCDISSYQALFWIACSSKQVFDKIILIFELFEQGRLKNQKMKKHAESPKLQVTRPWRALMTLPDDTVMELLSKVANLNCGLEEMTKDAEYLKSTRNVQFAVSKLSKMPWGQCLEKFWDGEEEAEEELSQFLYDVRRGVPGDRLRLYVENKLKDPTQKSASLIIQEDPLNFLKNGQFHNTPDAIIYNEETSEWQQLLRITMDLPCLSEDVSVLLTSSWEGVSDLLKALDLMYPSKKKAVIVFHNKASKSTQPYVRLITRRSAMPELIEGNSKVQFYEKLLNGGKFMGEGGNLLVLHCGKGEALKAAQKRKISVTGVENRKEMFRQCNRIVQD